GVTASSTLTASPTTSGPMPSPGMTASLIVRGMPLLTREGPSPAAVGIPPRLPALGAATCRASVIYGREPPMSRPRRRGGHAPIVGCAKPERNVIDMSIGLGIVLIVIGAILTFALNFSV